MLTLECSCWVELGVERFESYRTKCIDVLSMLELFAARIKESEGRFPNIVVHREGYVARAAEKGIGGKSPQGPKV